jgi:Peptidase M15
MASVNYHGYVVSDPEICRLLQTIADLYGRTVHVTSGDRNHVPKGGSKTSLHLQKRAADLYVHGVTLGKLYQDLKLFIAMVFDPTQGYEVIWHGPHTATGGPHLHLGHYPGKKWTGYVRFKTEGLTTATRGHYAVDNRIIPYAAPVVK